MRLNDYLPEARTEKRRSSDGSVRKRELSPELHLQLRMDGWRRISDELTGPGPGP